VCSFIVNKLFAADSNISPDGKKDGICISIPWFRLAITNLAFGVLFYWFQTRFNQIQTELFVATGTNQQNSFVKIQSMK